VTKKRGAGKTRSGLDVVDEIGRALRVEQPSDAPVKTSVEILSARDRDYWRHERRVKEEDD